MAKPSLDVVLARYRRGAIRNYQVEQAIDAYLDEMVAGDPTLASQLAANEQADKARTTLPPRVNLFQPNPGEPHTMDKSVRQILRAAALDAHADARAMLREREAANAAPAVEVVTQLASGITEILKTLGDVRAERDALAQSKRVPEIAAPLAPAPAIELNVIGRDAANQIRSVGVKADDGRSYILSVLGRDAGGNMSRLRLAPVAPAN
jgi:hypothetical protein